MMMEAGISVFTPDHSEVYAVTCLPRPSGPATIFGWLGLGAKSLRCEHVSGRFPRKRIFRGPSRLSVLDFLSSAATLRTDEG